MSVAHETSLTALAADPRAFGRLPELRGAPSPFRFALRVIARNWGVGRLTFVLPSGRELPLEGREPGPHGRLVVRDFRFMRRVLASGDIGFAEGYMAGEWETPDLSALLTAFALNFERLRRVTHGGALMRAVNRILHALNRNTRAGSKRNIHAHYDLGNAFYSRWLDPTMTYSSARFERPGQPLDEAQRHKYRTLAEGMDLSPDHHVLEIGCGWGGFAEYAARDVGARVTGITISREQFDFARRRMFEQGLAERADIRLVDYRDVAGRFDRVASIEMFEAVGERYWPAYFGKIRESLTPGGRAGLQIITIRDELFTEYQRRADFIQKYVFPGGMLPSEARLKAETDRAGLDWRGISRFGQHYADTLASWAQRFEAAWDDIRRQGFDERFRRLWRFYLSYCEAGFRTGQTDVVQLSLARA
ncbi:cyclopropane-fatty-acyl-phospholipid synthase family protein [Phenylobacterium sp.]|uniref:cyclopropane-fatty-acyl-phospholipid synthase family protein n=1 Tax=Phenylobacterium sp. TaxID=1871053 RepID=UPI002B93C1AB|nr:cyclopropane-fatty-acyl-phospholipid synthase family protein [Phenylobacterium sp.]HVI32907.1 cyclopropane-fatty-acyl-phospholipid synthase family protein [Phenylobacterium sp.]